MLACARADGRALIDRFAERADSVDAVFVAGFTNRAPLEEVTDRLIDLGFDRSRGRDAVFEIYAGGRMLSRMQQHLTGIDPQNGEVARRAARQLLHRIRHPGEPRCRVLVAPRVAGSEMYSVNGES
jgi:hypothetical protein